MDSARVMQLLDEVGGVLTNDHFVYTKDGHGPAYINKDAVFMYTHEMAELCFGIAEHFKNTEIDIVAGPAVGGAIMAQWVTYHLRHLTGKKILALYADKVEDEVDGRKVTNFIFKRGYDRFIGGRNVLITEDNLTTGGSVKQVVQLCRWQNGIVVGVGAMCNRGGVTAMDVGDVPELFSLANVQMVNYPADRCPLCEAGIPINTKIGKGSAFVAKHGQPVKGA